MPCGNKSKSKTAKAQQTKKTQSKSPATQLDKAKPRVEYWGATGPKKK